MVNQRRNVLHPPLRPYWVQGVGGTHCPGSRSGATPPGVNHAATPPGEMRRGKHISNKKPQII